MHGIKANHRKKNNKSLRVYCNFLLLLSFSKNLNVPDLISANGLKRIISYIDQWLLCYKFNLFKTISSKVFSNVTPCILFNVKLKISSSNNKIKIDILTNSIELLI